MIPFRNIFQLSTGDMIGRTLYFLAFAYLARVLGVQNYGILEFALSILTYLILLGDGGLEVWATRAAAQGRDVGELIGQVLPLRLLLAAIAFGALMLLLPVLPKYAGLNLILVILGMTLFVQAFNLKWAFMGQEKMKWVAWGLIAGQVVFSVCVFLFVRDERGLLLAPILRLAGDLMMATYFGILFMRHHRPAKWRLRLRGAREVLKASLPICLSQGLGLMGFNFDTVLLGLLLGSTAVGFYSAAYKPIVIVLSLPISYYMALFPALSRAYINDQPVFRETVARSLRFTSIFAVPIGVGGIFLAGPIILLLFGPAYDQSVPAMQILAWSASLVILRGTFRQALNAAERQNLDLRAAGISVGLNVLLNILLIPPFGIIGAATATLSSEIVWLLSAWYLFSKEVAPVNLQSSLFQPIAAALIMGAWFMLVGRIYWPIQAVSAVMVYFGTLLLMGHTDIRSWLNFARMRL